MNQYRVGYKIPSVKAGKPDTAKFDEVKAGTLDIEAGCLIFKKSVGSLDIVMAYKSWDFVIRVAVNVD